MFINISTDLPIFRTWRSAESGRASPVAVDVPHIPLPSRVVRRISGTTRPRTRWRRTRVRWVRSTSLPSWTPVWVRKPFWRFFRTGFKKKKKKNEKKSPTFSEMDYGLGEEIESVEKEIAFRLTIEPTVPSCLNGGGNGSRVARLCALFIIQSNPVRVNDTGDSGGIICH